ncbi:MAG: hypothetical protein ACM3Q2_01645, partial [Syntrophothermus sp.]
MSVYLHFRRSALYLQLIIIFGMPVYSHAGVINLNTTDRKVPAGEIVESIPYAGTWKLSKVKDVKV